MYGYAGRLLYVDLSRGRCEDRPLTQEMVRDYVGARGFGAKILYEEVKKGEDPLGPKNLFMLMTGPFANHPVPGGTRFLAIGKSPLTRGWGDANGAGRMGPMVKKAGYDGVVVKGKASSPVYLWVGSEGPEIRDASNLWGRDTGEVREKIQEETHEDAEVAVIGPGGENLVSYACVMSEYNRAAGRSGLGSVMGSKRLKAIAIYGEERQSVHDEKALKVLVKEMAKKIVNDPFCQNFRKYGTASGILPHNTLGMYPAYNFKEGYTREDLIQRVSGEYMAETILTKREACIGCPVACRRVVEVKDGPYAIEVKYGGPEFETIGTLGTCLGIFDLEAISKGNELCNRYGIDTINTGMSIAWAMECFEKGLLTTKDIDGLDLTWGNVESVLKLIEKIAFKDGFGALLARGLKEASKEVGKGSDYFAMEVKNQAFPVHMPRGKVGQGLSYATSNRGACHCQGMHDTSIEAGKTMPDIGFDEDLAGTSRLAKEKKARIEYLAQNLRCIQDSLNVCRFVCWDYGPTTPVQLIDIYEAITGISMNSKEFMHIGERIFNLCRMLNVQEGMSRRDDTLPGRVRESLPEGRTKGSVISEEDLQRMLDEYYDLRGWSKEGIPSRETLMKLKLDQCL